MTNTERFLTLEKIYRTATNDTKGGILIDNSKNTTGWCSVGLAGASTVIINSLRLT